MRKLFPLMLVFSSYANAVAPKTDVPLAKLPPVSLEKMAELEVPDVEVVPKSVNHLVKHVPRKILVFILDKLELTNIGQLYDHVSDIMWDIETQEIFLKLKDEAKGPIRFKGDTDQEEFVELEENDPLYYEETDLQQIDESKKLTFRLTSEEHIDPLKTSLGYDLDKDGKKSAGLNRFQFIANANSQITQIMVRLGTLVVNVIKPIESLIWSAVLQNKNILVLGVNGSGKTTVLRDILRRFPSIKDPVAIENGELTGGGANCIFPQIRSYLYQMDCEGGSSNAKAQKIFEVVSGANPGYIFTDEIYPHEVRTILNASTQTQGIVSSLHGNHLLNLMADKDLGDLLGSMETSTLGDETVEKDETRPATSKQNPEQAKPSAFQFVIQVLGKGKFLIIEDFDMWVKNVYARQATSALFFDGKKKYKVTFNSAGQYDEFVRGMEGFLNSPTANYSNVSQEITKREKTNGRKIALSNILSDLKGQQAEENALKILQTHFPPSTYEALTNVKISDSPDALNNNFGELDIAFKNKHTGMVDAIVEVKSNAEMSGEALDQINKFITNIKDFPDQMRFHHLVNGKKVILETEEFKRINLYYIARPAKADEVVGEVSELDTSDVYIFEIAIPNVDAKQ